MVFLLKVLMWLFLPFYRRRSSSHKRESLLLGNGKTSLNSPFLAPFCNVFQFCWSCKRQRPLLLLHFTDLHQSYIMWDGSFGSFFKTLEEVVICVLWLNEYLSGVHLWLCKGLRNLFLFVLIRCALVSPCGSTLLDFYRQLRLVCEWWLLYWRKANSLSPGDRGCNVLYRRQLRRQREGLLLRFRSL